MSVAPLKAPCSYRPSRSQLSLIPPALQSCQGIQEVCSLLLRAVNDASEITEALQPALSVLRKGQAAAIANLPAGPDDPKADEKKGTAHLESKAYNQVHQFLEAFPQPVQGWTGSKGLLHSFPTQSVDTSEQKFEQLEYLETDLTNFSATLQRLDDRLSSLRQSIQQTFQALNESYTFAQSMVNQILESNHTQSKKILGVG